MTYIIDRIEDGIAVIECSDGDEITMIELPKSALPKGARDGHVLKKHGEEYVIDHEATNERRAQLRERLNRLLKRG